MASTPLLSFRPTTIHACSATAHGRNNNNKSSPNWWAPVFGWAPDPDYIYDATDGGEKAADRDGAAAETGRKGNVKFGAFTEEKARQLRIRTVETSTFHDAMYHSAIASRLASDFKSRSVV